MRNFIKSAVLVAAMGLAGMAQAQDKKDITITLIPGLTTDAFYITMNRGAQAAAEALGITVDFQGAEEFDPVLQTPVLDAVIARSPDAILIAPTDSTQMIEPLRRANEAGIPVITVDTLSATASTRPARATPTSRCPTSPPTISAAAGWRRASWPRTSASKGKVYVSNVRPGISTTDQREEGFKDEMAAKYPDIEVLDTQYNENDASLAASQFQAVLARNPDIAGVFGANLFSAIGAGNGVASADKKDDVTVIAFDAPKSIVDNISSGLVDAAIAQHPGRDRLLRRGHGLCRTDRPVRAHLDRNRLHRHQQEQCRRREDQEVHLLRIRRTGMSGNNGTSFLKSLLAAWSWLFLILILGFFEIYAQVETGSTFLFHLYTSSRSPSRPRRSCFSRSASPSSSWPATSTFPSPSRRVSRPSPWRWSCASSARMRAGSR